MSRTRVRLIAAGCAIVALTGMSSQALRGQASGNGPTGPGQGKPGKLPGTVSTITVPLMIATIGIIFSTQLPPPTKVIWL